MNEMQYKKGVEAAKDWMQGYKTYDQMHRVWDTLHLDVIDQVLVLVDAADSIEQQGKAKE